MGALFVFQHPAEAGPEEGGSAEVPQHQDTCYFKACFLFQRKQHPD